MPVDSSRSVVRSRRHFLAGAGTLGAVASAGCLGSILSTSPSSEEIEPEEPNDNGTPGEFYTVVEANDVEVASLLRQDSDLALTYYSNAGDEEASLNEIATITTVYHEILVNHGTDLEMLYGEIANPFDEQAHGWGAKTEWFVQYDEGEMTQLTLWNSILNSRVFEGDVEAAVES